VSRSAFSSSISALAVAAALACAGCGSGNSTPAAKPRQIEPSTFAGRIDNPWFPLRPGTTYTYRGVKDGKPAVDVVAVTERTRRIEDVSCAVVRDRLYLRGRLAERTTDWYAQDKRGNVWYFGEATAELDPSGKVTSTEGSWEAGKRGAEAGIFMPAHPRPGQSFRQEFFRGHAEDHFRVVRLAANVRVPFGRSSRALLTEEWTPLEPGVLDHKYYLRGIGNVAERTVKGPKERLDLVKVTR
jgi:hypothetical protein